MIRTLTGMGIALAVAMAWPLQSAQSSPGVSAANCQQVRDAVATYGYAAARHYALIHYGKQAVAAGDRCLSKKQVTKTKKPVKPKSTKKKKKHH